VGFEIVFIFEVLHVNTTQISIDVQNQQFSLD